MGLHLKQHGPTSIYPTKAGVVDADVVYVGDSADGFATKVAEASNFVGRRKQDADDLGTIGSVTIDFDALLYDNKIASIAGDVTLNIQAPTRSGRYTLAMHATSAVRRNITWSAGTLSQLHTDSVLPSFVDTTEGYIIIFHSDDGVLDVELLPERLETIDVTTLSVAWQPDAGNGVYSAWELTGTRTAALVIIPILNMPPETICHIKFANAPTVDPLFGLGFNVAGDPTWDEETMLVVRNHNDVQHVSILEFTPITPNYWISAGIGTFDITGTDAALNYFWIPAGIGTFAITGTDATLTDSGA